MSKVVAIRCESYDQEEVNRAVERGLELLGGAGGFVSPGEKILFKPNLVIASSPDKCITTHPSVFRAVGEAFIKAGAILEYGDSPAVQSTESAARKSGLAKVAEELGATLADFRNGREFHFDAGIQNKRFFLANGVLDCDGIVNLPKLKTHGLERISGAVKNLFGCVPGTLKGEFHARVPDAISFARMLVDLNRSLKTRLHVMDAIWAMEGNGPTNGTPRKMNVLLFSSDPVALDATACRLIGLNPEMVPTVTLGEEAGLGVFNPEKIELAGDPLEDFIQKDFNVRKEPVTAYKPGGLVQFLQNALVPKPGIIPAKCAGCGFCSKVCPVNPKAIAFKDDSGKKGIPVYNYRRCIRCYCCQELCPEGAIELKYPIFRRFIHK